MSARVLALVLALWTGNQVVRVEAALSFSQIAEEEDCRLALLASHNNIPIAISKFGGHGGTLLLSGLTTWRRLREPATVVSVLQAKHDFLSLVSLPLKVYSVESVRFRTQKI